MERVDRRICASTTISRREAIGLAPLFVASACRRAQSRNNGPSITFTRIPQADPGGSASHDIIEGSVTGASPGQKIVLYARAGKWWVQPLVDQPLTALRPNFQWTNATHLGSHYAAMLVKEGYKPETALESLPQPNDAVLAIAVVPGAEQPPSPIVDFSGYKWRLRDAPSGRGGRNIYSPSNIRVDEKGAMHLHISKLDADWSCAETSLVRNLGYGTYEFVVRGLQSLEPPVVFSMFTYDYASGAQHNREMSIEVSRWGNPAKKNAQYVVQPYYVAANVHRFTLPPGSLTFSLEWQRDRAAFRTRRNEATVSEHVFTAGIPTPGIESMRMAFYIYRKSPIKLQQPMEVIVDRFTYFP
jgi:hypothetical protein